MVGSRGRPFANAANSYLAFTAGMSQKFGSWANIRPLLEKAKKLTICIGNSAPLRTFFLKNFEKFDYRFFKKTKTIQWPLLSYLAENQPGVHQFYVKQFGRDKFLQTLSRGPGKDSQANIGAKNMHDEYQKMPRFSVHFCNL